MFLVDGVIVIVGGMFDVEILNCFVDFFCSEDVLIFFDCVLECVEMFFIFDENGVFLMIIIILG